jgi:hypothetical protein
VVVRSWLLMRSVVFGAVEDVPLLSLTL